MPLYTPEQLSRLTGVSARTVRYYVDERLIDPPAGRGRGAHFEDKHLSQLRRVRLLQRAGLDNRTIREHREDLERILTARGVRLEDVEKGWGSFVRQAGEAWAELKADEGDAEIDELARVTIAPGLVLLVDDTHRLPAPQELRQMARAVRSAFAVSATKSAPWKAKR